MMTQNTDEWKVPFSCHKICKISTRKVIAHFPAMCFTLQAPTKLIRKRCSHSQYKPGSSLINGGTGRSVDTVTALNTTEPKVSKQSSSPRPWLSTCLSQREEMPAAPWQVPLSGLKYPRWSLDTTSARSKVSVLYRHIFSCNLKTKNKHHSERQVTFPRMEKCSFCSPKNWGRFKPFPLL